MSLLRVVSKNGNEVFFQAACSNNLIGFGTVGVTFFLPLFSPIILLITNCMNSRTVVYIYLSAHF